MLRYLPMNTVYVFLFFVLGLATAGQARADIARIEEAIKPAIVGNSDAPVTIIEYASLGCSHCAHFHNEIYPKLKRDYIDTGKAKLVFIDFPLGTPALAAAMIARCSGPKRYLGFINIFFRAQRQWSHAENPLEALKKTARFGGLNSDDVDACLKQQKLIDYLQETARKASTEHEINSTPSFLINGKKVAGALEYEKFREYVDEALKKAK